MKRKIVKSLAGIVLVLGTSALLQAKMTPKQLSADMTMFQKNKVFDEGKLYVGSSAGRMDWPKTLKQTQIFRFDSDKIEGWMHNGKMIIEMKMQYNALVHQLPEGFREECVGEEVLDGHPCQKCKISGTFMGQKINSTVWKAKDLNMIIKNMDDNGNGTVIKNIALGPQPSNLFEAPKDYRKLTLPGGGLNDILKGMSN